MAVEGSCEQSKDGMSESLFNRETKSFSTMRILRPYPSGQPMRSGATPLVITNRTAFVCERFYYVMPIAMTYGQACQALA